MSLTAITGAGVYYLEAGEVHGDIVTPVIGDLAIYTYAATGEFIGKEYSYSGSAWFERDQIKASADGSVSIQSVMAESEITSGTLAEMASDAATLSPANKGKRWQATDDSDQIYVYAFVSGAWDYYPESGLAQTASGESAVLVAIADINGASGYPDIRTITFNNAADLPTDETAITVAELITLNSYAAGAKRCRVSFHSTSAGTNIPFAGCVGIVVNGSQAEAAAILSVSDLSEGGTGAVANGGRLVSQTQPVIEFSLDDSTADIDTVYLVGYAPGGTGVAIVKVSVEAW